MSIIPDTPSAVAFLAAMHPQRRVHLVAIYEGGRIEAKSFAPHEVEALRRWIDKRQGKANLYWHVNELKSDVRNIKAKKEHVAAAHFLHVDVDDLTALERIRSYTPRPTAVVFSGGGYQAFWRLVEPCTDLSRVERCNIKIAEDLGGDHCHNVDRIMRLPGTINVPNAKKRAAGRTEALAYVL